MDDNPNKLSDTFRDQPLASHGPAWDSLWKESFTPWDRGGLSWALNDVLAEHKDLIPAATEPGSGGSRKKALVPGCGRGHDVLLLAAWGYDVYGLDYSSAATARAVENEKTAGGDVVYAARDEAVGKGGVRWVTGDFFSDAWVDGETITAGFDLIFDYTFFCALPPSARPKWAARMSQLLAPDGRLVCLQWPSIKPPSEPGPPWGVTPDLYLAHLSRPGDEVPYGPDGSAAGADALAAQPSPTGLKRLALATPARTHRTGTLETGEVHDRVSIWSHL